MDYEPKISPIESYLLITGAVGIDAIGVGLILFGLDDFFLLDLVGICTQGYLRFKQVNGAGYDLAGSIAEFVPYVGALPLKTAGILYVLYADKHPESIAAQAASAVSAKIPTKRAGFKNIPGGKALPSIDSVSKAA